MLGFNSPACQPPPLTAKLFQDNSEKLNATAGRCYQVFMEQSTHEHRIRSPGNSLKNYLTENAHLKDEEADNP